MLTQSPPPKAGYMQRALRWLYYLLIVIVINVFLVFLLLRFVIIPYLVKVGDLPNNTPLNLYEQAFSGVPDAEIFSPITTTTIPTYTSATPPSLPQDVRTDRRTVIYL